MIVSKGSNMLDKVIDIDQSPIGRTPRSNPATYTGAFTPDPRMVRQPAGSKSARLCKPGRFSFNVKGGRCEACQGDGRDQDRDAFFARCLCHSAMSARASATTAKRWKSNHLQRQVHRRRARHDGGRSGVISVQAPCPPSADKMETLQPRRPRLHPRGPAGDNAVGRRGAARQTRQKNCQNAVQPAARSTFLMSQPPACISMMSEEIAGSAA